MSRRLAFGSLGFLSTLVVASSALAHVRLVYPTARYPEPTSMMDLDENIKEGPCGVTGDSRTTDASRITTLEAGSTITVEFKETVGHDGWFRLAFLESGQDFPDAPTTTTPPTGAPQAPILLDGIMDGARNPYTAEITLPNTPCDNCTLQLIQVMTDRQVESYYTCADLVLTAPAGSGGTGGTSAGGTAGDAGGGSGNLGGGGASTGGTSGASGAGTGAGGAGAGGAGAGGAGAGGRGGSSGIIGTSGTTMGGATGSSGTGTSGSPAGGMSGTSASTSGSGGTMTAPTAGSATTAVAPLETTEEGGCSVAGGRRKTSSLVLLGLGLLAGFAGRRRFGGRRRA